MVKIKELTFISNFFESYYRNNRTSGQKSLRCFPCCSEGGHVHGNFCGTPLSAHATLEKTDETQHMSLNEINIIGQIRSENEDGFSSMTSISNNIIVDNIRDYQRNKFSGELLVAKVELIREYEDRYEVCLTFNEELNSYDYSWKSNRWSISGHVIDIFVIDKFLKLPVNLLENIELESNKENLTDKFLNVYSSICSSPFKVISTHVNKPKHINSEAIKKLGGHRSLSTNRLIRKAAANEIERKIISDRKLNNDTNHFSTYSNTTVNNLLLLNDNFIHLYDLENNFRINYLVQQSSYSFDKQRLHEQMNNQCSEEMKGIK